MSDYEKIRTKYDKEMRYDMMRVAFTVGGLWILFHIFGLWIWFNYGAIGAIVAAFVFDMPLIGGAILWRLSKKFIKKEE